MPAYLVAVYSYPDRATATADTIQSVLADSCVHAIHDTPPVVLSGLVKGGEIRTVDDWHPNMLDTMCVCVAADGRYVPDRLSAIMAAEARGALPISWYHYEV